MFGVIIVDASYLSIDFGEEFELSFDVPDDFSIEGAEDEGIFSFEGRVEGRVDF